MNSEIDNVPSFEEFRNEIKRIYPEGDLAKALTRLRWFIENEKFCQDGTPITYRLIMDKFAAHIKQWNMKYGSRDPKYIGKAEEEKRKDLYEFIGMRMFEREFSVTTGYNERDDYLFGGFSKKYLQERIEEFDKSLKNE